VLSRSGTGTTERTKTLTGTTTVQGNLTINTSNNLATNNNNIAIQGNLDIQSGTLTAGTTNIISIQGNWTGSGTFAASTGTVRFYGNRSSEINRTGNLNLYNLIIDKNAKSNTVDIKTSVTIAENAQATFTMGIVNTSVVYDESKPLLIFSQNAKAADANHNSHVNGYVRKNGNDKTFTFPIGNGVVYRPAGVDTKSNGDFTYDARYINRATTGDTSYDPLRVNSPLSSVNRFEYWHIEAVVPNSSTNVVLSWEMPVSGGGNVNYLGNTDKSLVTAFWDGNNTTGRWNNNGVTSTSAPAINPATTPGSIQAGGATNKNRQYWTIGAINITLPIDLMYLRATTVENNVQLDWATAQEINNDYFTIEKSADGKNFTEVATVNGKGNSKEVNKYSAVDYAPYSGVTYYRLKQTDFDGKFTYSKTVAVQMNSIANSLQAYSLGSKALQLNYKIGGEENAALTIHDSRGVQVWSKLVSGTAAEIKEEVNMQSAANGMYIISLQTASGTITKKVIMF
jgi:hypothetical protein